MELRFGVNPLKSGLLVSSSKLSPKKAPAPLKDRLSFGPDRFSLRLPCFHNTPARWRAALPLPITPASDTTAPLRKTISQGGLQLVDTLDTPYSSSSESHHSKPLRANLISNSSLEHTSPPQTLRTPPRTGWSTSLPSKTLVSKHLFSFRLSLNSIQTHRSCFFLPYFCLFCRGFFVNSILRFRTSVGCPAGQSLAAAECLW